MRDMSVVTCWRAVHGADAQDQGPRTHRPLHLPVRGLGEVALLAALWVVYSASRLLADTDLAAARDHAGTILDVERALHLDVELWLDQHLASITWVGVTMSYWYALLHYVVTPLVLVFVFVRHRADYARARNVIVLGSALGLVTYILLPTAPPRLMNGAWSDALATYAGWGWWSDHASAPAGLGQLTNELAAMPSLHVGWTVWVVWALWRYLGRTGRAVTIAYSLGTTLVVVATGNHWLLDAAAGAVVIAVGVVLTRPVGEVPAAPGGAEVAHGARPERVQPAVGD